MSAPRPARSVVAAAAAANGAEPPFPHAGTAADGSGVEVAASVGPAEAHDAAGRAGRRIARSATLIMLGSITGRVLGLVREQTIAALFGATAAASIFSAANRVPTMVYDLLIGGALTAALVPVFSEYAERDARRGSSMEASEAGHTELGTLSGAVLMAALSLLLPVVLALVFLARPLMGLMGVGFDPGVQEEGIRLVRLALFAVVLQGCSAVLMGVAYALHRVTLPAFAPAAYNLGIIVCALVLTRWLGVTSLIVGMLIGAAGQFLLQLPGMRGVHLRLRFSFGHPGLRRIVALYTPVAAGLVVSVGVVTLDTRLASQTGEGSLAAMRYATTLVQLPLGLVATALSFASLPVLSRFGANGARDAAFKRTLAMGLKAGVLLVMPAAVALIVLRVPVVQLLFQHGRCAADCGQVTATALLFYAPQIPFVVADQLLIAGFYALQNTRLPMLVGVLGAGVYVAVALATVGPFGMTGLVLANTLQNSVHAVVLLGFLWQAAGSFWDERLMGATARVVAAGGVMALALWGLQHLMAAPSGTVHLLLYLAFAGTVALVVYVGALLAMRSEELAFARTLIVGRVRRTRTEV